MLQCLKDSKETKNEKEIYPPPYRLKAFALSEVLITLVIIGIIAAITVPLLVANYQKEAFRSALQKNYSILQQVNEMYYIENGEKIDAFTDYHSLSFKKYIKKYYNVIKDCNRFGCVEMLGKDSNLYKTYNGNDFYNNVIDDGHLVLADGTSLYIENPTMDAGNGRVWVWFDVNGYGKKPNRVGVDLFAFELTKDGEFLPMGAKGTTFYGRDNIYCSKTSQSSINGINCTYKVLRGD